MLIILFLKCHKPILFFLIMYFYLLQLVQSIKQCSRGSKFFSYENNNSNCIPFVATECVKSCEWNTNCIFTSHYLAFQGRRTYVSGILLNSTSFLVQCCASLGTIVQLNAKEEPVCTWLSVIFTTEKKKIYFNPPLSPNEYIREISIQRKENGIIKLQAQICKFNYQRYNCDKTKMSTEEARFYIFLLIQLLRTKKLINNASNLRVFIKNKIFKTDKFNQNNLNNNLSSNVSIFSQFYTSKIPKFNKIVKRINSQLIKMDSNKLFSPPLQSNYLLNKRPKKTLKKTDEWNFKKILNKKLLNFNRRTLVYQLSNMNDKNLLSNNSVQNEKTQKFPVTKKNLLIKNEIQIRKISNNNKIKNQSIFTNYTINFVPPIAKAPKLILLKKKNNAITKKKIKLNLNLNLNDEDLTLASIKKQNNSFLKEQKFANFATRIIQRPLISFAKYQRFQYKNQFEKQNLHNTNEKNTIKYKNNIFNNKIENELINIHNLKMLQKSQFFLKKSAKKKLPLKQLLDCCHQQAPKCKHLCSTNVSKDEIKQAIVSNQCAPLSMTSVIQCFPKFYNISSVNQCCQSYTSKNSYLNIIHSFNNKTTLPQQCLNLCTPNFKLSFAHFACIDHISTIVECYRTLLN